MCFYPQRLSTMHVPSQDNHAAGVREVSEHTVCLVFHSQVTGQTLLMDLFHTIQIVHLKMTYNTDSVWHSTLCLASARDTPYLGRYSITSCYDCFNEPITKTICHWYFGSSKPPKSRLEQPRPHSKPGRNIRTRSGCQSWARAEWEWLEIVIIHLHREIPTHQY